MSTHLQKHPDGYFNSAQLYLLTPSERQPLVQNPLNSHNFAKIKTQSYWRYPTVQGFLVFVCLVYYFFDFQSFDCTKPAAILLWLTPRGARQVPRKKQMLENIFCLLFIIPNLEGNVLSPFLTIRFFSFQIFLPQKTCERPSLSGVMRVWMLACDVVMWVGSLRCGHGQ